MPVITGVLGMGLGLFLPQGIEPRGGTEAVIGPALFKEGFGVFLIEPKPLGLDIGACRSPDVRALTPAEAEPGKGIVEILDKGIIETGPVRIFQAKYKGALLGLGEKVIE
jgi:hypothetical protein